MTSNFKSLKHPTNFALTLNEGEEAFAIGWGVIKDEVNRLLKEGWEYDRKGNREKANLRYRAANYYFYLLHYAIIMKNYLQNKGKYDVKCNGYELEDNFKINCVEDNLQCLSTKFGANYVKAWSGLMGAFYIDRTTVDCEKNCCQGIGDMVVNNSEDCSSLIIGECE